MVGRSLEAALAPDAAAPLRAILLSDRSWRAARSLGSVHGIDLLEAAQISRDHPTRTSGSTLLQEELTPCQRLALTGANDSLFSLIVCHFIGLTIGFTLQCAGSMRHRDSARVRC